jgi:hypothetical protein
VVACSVLADPADWFPFLSPNVSVRTASGVARSHVLTGRESANVSQGTSSSSPGTLLNSGSQLTGGLIGLLNTPGARKFKLVTNRDKNHDDCGAD